MNLDLLAVLILATYHLEVHLIQDVYDIMLLTLGGTIVLCFLIQVWCDLLISSAI